MSKDFVQPQPLWEVLESAFLAGRSPGYNDRFGYAGELRALADVVEWRGDKGLDLDPGETADWLRAEAVKAEAILETATPSYS